MYNDQREGIDFMADLEFIKEKNAITSYAHDGKLLAEITFPETSPGEYTIDHTFVDSSLRGQGIASQLVSLAVDAIQMQGGTVLATCPYAVKWLSEHKTKEPNQ